MTDDLVPPTRIMWCDDGDIILSVNEKDRDTNPTHYHFRVHSTILRVASPVFRDMLSIPQPTETTPNLDGCPVVHLEDSPDDLQAFLDALYGGLAMVQGHKLSLDTALSILLLSDKYSAEGMRQGIIRILQEDWPLNRTDYLNRQKLLGSPGCRVVQSAKLIKIARVCNVPEFLPTAFYELAASSIRTFSAVEVSVLGQHLSPVDLLCLMEGRKRLEERILKMVPTLQTGERDVIFLWHSDPDVAPIDIWNRPPDLLCKIALEHDDEDYFCSEIGASFLNAVGKRLAEGEFMVNIVGQLQQKDAWIPNMCPGCSKWLAFVMKNKEKEIWENIPTDFGLPKIDPKLYSESMFRTR